jgi:hypothetical protein
VEPTVAEKTVADRRLGEMYEGNGGMKEYISYVALLVSPCYLSYKI